MKKLLILFLIGLCFISVVNALDNATIVKDSLSLSGQRGSTIQSSFTVNNTGDTILNLDFLASTLADGANTLSVNFISSETNFANGTSRTVSFSIPVSASQVTGTYNGEINVTNSSNGFVFDTMNLNVVVTGYSLNASPSYIFFGSAIRNSTRTFTFTIANDGEAGLTNITPTSSAAAKYEVTFNKTSAFDLDEGESETIEVTVLIPIDELTTNHSIGSIGMNSDEFDFTNLVAMNTDVKGGLVIEEFDVRVYYRGGNSDVIHDISNGQKLDFDEDVRPGSELEFKIDIENTFNSNEDIDIENVVVIITVKEIEYGEDDLDEDSSEFDLEPTEEERVIILFDIPLEVEEGSYDILVEIEGEDNEGTVHKIEWNLEFDLSKKRRDIAIRKAELTENLLSCDRDTKLNIEVLNIGSRDEDGMKVEAINRDIGLNFVEDDIELFADPFEEDDEYSKSLSIVVDDDVEAGTYPIIVNAYLAGDALLESKTVDLEVEDCETAEEVEETEEEIEEEVAEEEPEVGEIGEESSEIPVISGGVTETMEASLTKPIIFFLATVGILSGGIGIFFVMKFIIKKRI